MIIRILTRLYPFFAAAMLIYIIAFLVLPAQGMQEYYQANQCELIAKDYIRGNGGHLVFIQPLTESGAFDFGEFAGHWMNRAYSRDRGIYFYDWSTDTYFNNTKEVSGWYKNTRGKDNIVYDFAVARPDFPIIWHY